MVVLFEANPILPTLLEHCPTGVVLTDNVFNIIWTNKSAHAFLHPGNNQMDSLIGKPLHQIITPMDPTQLDAFSSRFNLTQSKACALTAMVNAGENKYVEVTTIKLGYDGATSYCCYVREVDTDTVSQSERETCIMNNSLDAVVQADIDAHIIGWNKMAEQIFGWTEAEMIGKSLQTIIPEALRRKHELSFHAYQEYESFGNILNKRHETIGLRKDGVEIPIEICVSAFSFANGIRFFSAFIRDLSQDKIMKSIEAANEAKSIFMSAVSHELRSPLNAIFGFSQLLSELPLTTDQHDYVESILCATEGLIQLVSDLSDLSKIEAQKVALDIAPFDIATVLCESINSTALQIKCKHVEIASFFSPFCPAHVIGDARRLKQVLMNLLTNAVKFTDDGSIVVNVSLKQESAGVTELLFKVRDTGVGISPEDIPKLFQRYSQLGPGIAYTGGSGLGLSICSELVRLMGGTIGVDSEGKGKGTTFWFTCKLGVGSCACRVQPVPKLGPFCNVLIGYADTHIGVSMVRLLQCSYNFPSMPRLCGNMFELFEAAATSTYPQLLVFIDEDIGGYNEALLSQFASETRKVYIVLVKRAKILPVSTLPPIYDISSAFTTAASSTLPALALTPALTPASLPTISPPITSPSISHLPSPSISVHTSVYSVDNVYSDLNKSTTLTKDLQQLQLTNIHVTTMSKPIDNRKLKKALEHCGIHAPPEEPQRELKCFLRSTSPCTTTIVSGPQHAVPACILVAEDNPLNYKIAARMLQNAGYVCKQAANGHDVINQLSVTPYNLILMDCQMPVMDGYATTKRIRELEGDSNQHIPIVAMTANAMHGDRERCLSSGMDDYVSKPFQKQKLLDIVNKWTTTQQFMFKCNKWVRPTPPTNNMSNATNANNTNNVNSTTSTTSTNKPNNLTNSSKCCRTALTTPSQTQRRGSMCALTQQLRFT